jgi:peptidoglycan/xylan/chitin deacetylase (PgdA/CDA1 family)
MNPRSYVVAGLACSLASSLSCSKVAELGNKLKAPEANLEQVQEPSKAAELTIVPPPPEPGSESALVNVDAEVSILTYHDFSATREAGDMVIRPGKFRKQMETLKSSGISVIPMSEYLAWKKGKASIPSPSVVITIDDGWEGVYTDAFPTLREYRYPFSIYLYTNYLGGSGRSLSDEQIREMLAAGCEIGVHSVSHADMTERRGRTESDYETWLREELGESLRLLRERYGDKVLPVFAYPYGKYNKQILEIAREFGYELGVTVWGKRAAFDTADLEVGRFIIHGKDDRNYRYALAFKGMKAMGTGALAAAMADGAEGKRIPVSIWPKENDIIQSRTPAIVIDVSSLGAIERESITLDISGYGRVPVEFDAAAGIITHQVVEPLRNDSCQVSLKLKRQGQTEMDSLTWAFQVDRTALYLGNDTDATAGRYSSGGGSIGG